MSYENRGYRSRQEGGGRYRQGGNGGGGGGGPYRRRDDRRSYNNRRPYDRPPESHKEDELEDIEIRLKGLIIKIGDKFTPELQVNLTKMKNILDNDYSKYPDTVQNTLTACICELPGKAPVYGTLIGLLNTSSHDIVAKLMVHFNTALTESIAASNWFRLKQILRFYGELVNANVVSPTAYANLLLDLLVVLDQPNQLCKRLDCIVYIVLSTLPWCARELNERGSSELEQILKKIEIYMQRRGDVKVLDVLQHYSDERYSTVKEEPLAHIWSLIQELQAKSWKLSLIPKPYRWFDSEFSSSLQHDLPRVNLPSHKESIAYLEPTPSLKLLVDDEGNTLPVIPNHDSIEYFILQELIGDTLNLYEVNRKDCAKYLLNLPYNCEPRYFKSAASDDSMDEDEEDESGWNLSDLLVESMFAHLLRLPSSTFRQMFYSCVITELCRAEVATFPMALGRAVKTLFDRLPFMDVECIHRLYSWFSHHLSNFGFQWDWKSWEGVLTMDSLAPQSCFIREVLEKEIRLSYYERIKSMLPENFQTIIPVTAPAPDFKFSDTSDPLNVKSKEIIDSLRTKKSVEEIRDLLAKYKDELASQGVNEGEQQSLVRELFIQCLLLVGSKSFSHVLNVVERYLEVLRFLNSAPEGRLHTVQILASFWKNNTQFLGILLDKLLNYRVIDPTCVITWVFEEEQFKHAGRAFVWEILKNTLGKVNSRVAQVKSKLDNLQSIHEMNKAKRLETEVTEMSEAEEQQELDSIRIVENSLATVTRERKEVFLLVCQKFAQVLSAIDSASQQWIYWWISGWYKEILRVNYKECKGFIATLETLVFTSDLDKRILDVFNDVKALTEQDDLLVRYHYINKMHLSFTYFVAIAAVASLSSARSIERHGHHQHKTPKGKAFDHFLQIWFENEARFADLAKEGILLDNYNAITHPSQPNYIAAAGGSNFGITDDDYYNIPANVTSIFDLIEKKGLTWKMYQENIPSIGNTDYRIGTYVRKHNPAASFDSIGLNKTRLQNIVGGDQFEKDIEAGTLPNWMFYTPDMNSDGHDTNASYAGNWLANFYKTTLNNKKLLDKTVILITFDETRTFPIRNRIWSLLLGAIPKKLKGTTDSTFYTHFSTLSTVEHNWDLGNLGRQDTNKTVSNVFEFAAKKLRYKNIHIAEYDIPWMNNTIPGLLTGKSWNATHSTSIISV
ncbi:hypothetical protein G6F57_006109 [Rhizopus arrhizus]|uniref:MIF4G domain-containing protein n=1 Tax=Rhizopus oryzae TaxID=64495 RepID=A0A9P7BSF3_RHIOR|nr:hypothetical protein G6F23_002949 [Rhizopus arrhizus]KAG1424571.1 hypothetical protein G6F58_002315 [Rhizopus delemar]KAG0763640.1 hypothetical protein G6F24_005852 [Rhizopus arrhizus]KAG0916194.1 hypothetical protein G6F33_002621 [Rhizopus arrhizus]KAG0939355.1 hypothetical protein G6F30_007295 [Rhizopus arrhizus]